MSFDTFVVYAQTNVFLKGRGDETDTTLNTFLRDKWDLLLVPTCVGILHGGGGSSLVSSFCFFKAMLRTLQTILRFNPILDRPV